MLMPKKVKNDNRKMHRGRMSGPATQGNNVDFGEFGLVATEPAWITSRQIEAARIAMTRHIKRGGKVWIRIFPDKSYTKKPLETRMGKGKAPVEGWVAVVKPGRVMFEMDGVETDVAKEAMRLAAFKLPIHCKFVVRPPDAERAKEKEAIYAARAAQQAREEEMAAAAAAAEATADESAAATDEPAAESAAAQEETE